LHAKDFFSAIALGGDLSSPEALWLIDELESRESGCVCKNPRLCSEFEIRVIDAGVRPHIAHLLARKVLSPEARSYALKAVQQGAYASGLLARLIIVHCQPAVSEFSTLRASTARAEFADLILTTPAGAHLEEYAGYLEVLGDASPHVGVEYLLARDNDAIVELFAPRLLSPVLTPGPRTTDEEQRTNFIYANNAMRLARRFSHLSEVLLSCGDETVSQAIAYETDDEETQRRVIELPVQGDAEVWFSTVRGKLDALIHNPALGRSVRRELREALRQLPKSMQSLPEVRRARRATRAVCAKPLSTFWMERYRERTEGATSAPRDEEWRWEGTITRTEAARCAELILENHLDLNLLSALADGWCGTPLELVSTTNLLGARLAA
jgi:hypothetical protein